MNFRADNYDIGENYDVLKDLQSKTKTIITNKILNSHQFSVCLNLKIKIILTFLTKIGIKEVLLLKHK